MQTTECFPPILSPSSDRPPGNFHTAFLICPYLILNKLKLHKDELDRALVNIYI